MSTAAAAAAAAAWHDDDDDNNNDFIKDGQGPPPYEKTERLPPSYHDIRRADRHAATGWKGSLRRMFPLERRFETVTLGGPLPSSGGGARHTTTSSTSTTAGK